MTTPIVSALSPVSVAVLGILKQDATLMGLTTGGWHEDVPPAPVWPFGWYEVRERDVRGFGTGGLPEVELRTHVFSQVSGLAQAQRINNIVVHLLKDASLTVEGYQQCGLVFSDESIPIADSEINGVKCHELVSFFRIYVEQL